MRLEQGSKHGCRKAPAGEGLRVRARLRLEPEKDEVAIETISGGTETGGAAALGTF